MNKQIKIGSGKLFFDTLEVQLDQPINDKLLHRIYVIRAWDEHRHPHLGGSWSFCGGLDLSTDLSKFWLGGFFLGDGKSHPETWTEDINEIATILNTLHPWTVGKKWAIFEEDYSVIHSVGGFLDEDLKRQYAEIAAEEDRQSWDRWCKDMEQFED